jgi:hypothetical protein
MKKNVKQCAHPACSCMVAEADEFCSKYCEDAGREEVEISCDCGHKGCALTSEVSLSEMGEPAQGSAFYR